MTPGTGLHALDGLEALVVATALGAARAVPVVWLVPALGGPRVPATARLGLGLLLAWLAAPLWAGAPGGAALVRLPVLALSALLAREVLVGVCLGLVAGAAFRAAEMAGRIADTLRGAHIAEVLVPTSEERASPLGALYALLATVVFLQLGGVHRVIDALMSSYEALPLLTPFGVGQARGLAAVVVAASARLLASGVGLAAPVVVAIWLTDLALGLIARAAPQLPVYFLGLPLKGLLAIGVVLVGLSALESALVGDLGAWLRLLARAVAALGAS